MLPTYQNILVATDFTENSDHAFRHAVLLARLHDAKIHLLHVIAQIEPVYLSSLLGTEERMKQLKREHEQKALDKIKQQLEDFATEELAGSPQDLERFDGAIATSGDPATKILETAEQTGADAIVMGTHSKGAIEHAFLGSVAEKVLQQTKRPVFVIPLPD